MKFVKSVLAVVVLSAAAMAQAPKPPVVSEVERLKLENVSLKMAGLQQQYAALQQEKAQVAEAITKENPGYHWQVNPQTGQEGLVPDAAPAKPAAKK